MFYAEIEAFLAVVEEGSFTKASVKLAQTKARTSQQISKLEKELGCMLLLRSTRKISLTDVGERYYNECRHAANILLQAQNQLFERQNKLSGVIKLNSVGGIFSEKMLAPALLSFIKLYPDIKVELSLSSDKVDFMQGDYDLVIRMGVLENSNLIARKLLDLNTHVVASPDYLDHMLNSPKELVNYNCLSGSFNQWSFKNSVNHKTTEVFVTGNMNVGNGHILCEAALSGVGIVRLNELYTDAYIKADRLRFIFDDWRVPITPISLLYPRTKHKTNCVKVFSEYLVEWFRVRI
jgi:DNA-binding transcriptional LysR family regulator